jgi:general secretion pathway protein J
MTRNGFTLVEMLVALTIFGMLAAGGVALLTFTVNAQEISAAKLSDVSAIRRAGAIMTGDFAQAAARPYRDESGAGRPAFAGSPEALSMVRRGWENHDGAARPSMQRLEYRRAGNRLERLSYPYVDGAAASRPVQVLEDLTEVTFRYRASNGEWHEAWAPGNPDDLPSCVEIVFTSPGHGTVRQLFLVGAAA